MTTAIPTIDTDAEIDPSWGRSRWPGLVATALLVASAALQFAASAQRWQFADPSVIPADRSIEDHLFDYAFPSDPWISVGSAAILFGIASLLIAAALTCLAMGARSVYRHGVVLWIAGILAAAPSALAGVHAVLSGVLGTPSSMQYVVATVGAFVLGLAQAAGLVFLAVVVARRSIGWTVGILALIGTTVMGHIVALFIIAPAIVGYTSFDTTPWSEAVVAGFTLVAAIAVLAGSLRPRR
jgi:hypothetical protein